MHAWLNVLLIWLLTQNSFHKEYKYVIQNNKADMLNNVS